MCYFKRKSVNKYNKSRREREKERLRENIKVGEGD